MKNYKNIIIYGAGASGVIIKNLFERNKKSNIIAFIDDNPNLSDRLLLGIKILHSSILDNSYIIKNKIDAIVVSNLAIYVNQSDNIKKFGLPIILPSDVQNWKQGFLTNSDLREIDSGFIINREIQQNIPINIIKEFKDKTILITGAAGSIGSEITNQLNLDKRIKLILIDINESSIFDLYNNLKNKNNCKYYVCDISCYNELKKVFSANNKIDYVFHAAAYKHVPIVEKNPYPAIRVNIKGTLNLCILSKEFNVKNFTLVSTDKAVNPTNIMGLSKRCAEIIISEYKKISNYNYKSTRFGNVFGSRGSVIPLFIDQIRKGGPITLTHNEITRYFMTIPEAAQLVIKSSLITNESGIYFFDMGQPIKLKKIIKNLLLYFNKPDVKTEIIGLRSGEKLYEELHKKNEKVVKTKFKKIYVIPNDDDLNDKFKLILDISENYINYEFEELKEKLKLIVPEYNQ